MSVFLMLVLCWVSSLGVSTRTASGHQTLGPNPTPARAAYPASTPQRSPSPPLQPLGPKPSESRLAPFSQPIHSPSANPCGSTFWIPPESPHSSGTPPLPHWPRLSPGPLISLRPSSLFSLLPTQSVANTEARGSLLKPKWDRVAHLLEPSQGPRDPPPSALPGLLSGLLSSHTAISRPNSLLPQDLCSCPSLADPLPPASSPRLHDIFPRR